MYNSRASTPEVYDSLSVIEVNVRLTHVTVLSVEVED